MPEHNQSWLMAQVKAPRHTVLNPYHMAFKKALGIPHTLQVAFAMP